MWGLQYLKMNTEEEIDDKEHTDETTVDQTKIQELPLIDYEESDKEEWVSKNGSIMIEVEINSNPQYYNYDTIK